MKCRKETPTPPRTKIWPQGELLQLAADAQKVLPRAAAANRSGVSSEAAGKKWMILQGQSRTGTTAQQERPYRTHSHAAANSGMKQGNSNGGSRVGGSACDKQALVASVKIRIHVRFNHSFIPVPPTRDRAATLDAHSVQLPKNLLCSSHAQGTLMKLGF
ncbi:hypothetical protein NDU88_002356 [Pleurodeles waltl]|uniref:Uncharacterized protein n=1 Tax=Pleurodeles waltl TaxID=8319 RepID=A0AAV7M0B1_PLEWA|nr:hypothetical protein NDU88_002356 [Pleurodeles waltl]